MIPPELSGYQQSSLARWRREILDNEANNVSSEFPNTENITLGTNENISEDPKYIDIVSSIYGMRQDLERIRKPIGTRENPVMTCKDLFYGHPQFKDGELLFYSIDYSY